MKRGITLLMISIILSLPLACDLSSDPCYTSKDPDTQIKACTDVIGSSSYKQDVAFNNRCSGYFDKKQFDLALADCTKAIQLNKEYDSPYIGRGNIYFTTGQYDKAMADYTRAIELNPRNAAAYVGRGITCEKKGLPDQALVDYDKAIELQPNYALAWMNRGNVFAGENQFAQALADYNKAITLDPNYPVTYYNLAQLYAKKNDSSETCKWLERYAKFGNVNYEFLRQDKAFDRFRDTPCYKNLVRGK